MLKTVKKHSFVWIHSKVYEIPSEPMSQPFTRFRGNPFGSLLCNLT